MRRRAGASSLAPRAGRTSTATRTKLYYELNEPWSNSRDFSRQVLSAAKTAGPTPCRSRSPNSASVLYFLFTDFFSSSPGENFATFRAAILMVAPVCGLRPFRAFLCDTEKVPKPIIATPSSLRRLDVIQPTQVTIRVLACETQQSHRPPFV